MSKCTLEDIIKKRMIFNSIKFSESEINSIKTIMSEASQRSNKVKDFKTIVYNTFILLTIGGIHRISLSKREDDWYIVEKWDNKSDRENIEYSIIDGFEELKKSLKEWLIK